MNSSPRVPRVPAADAEAGITALRKFGVVVVERAFDPDVVDGVREAVMARHPEFANPAALTDFQDNGEHRFIAPVAISREIHDSGMLRHEALATIASGVLGENWVVEACGITMALPGCAAQKLHRDGGSLYPETPLSAMLPAFALTVMIPLVDVEEDGGTTAFRLGTHLYDPKLEKSDTVSTTLKRGSIIVWDFEILHGGEPNRSDRPRPMLYLTLCRPFWTDMTNFGGTARIRLAVDKDVAPLLDRRFARAADGGTWAHRGLGERLKPIEKGKGKGDVPGPAR